MIRFINFGKFKSIEAQNLFQEYLKRISRYTNVQEINFKILKDEPAYFEKIKEKIIEAVKDGFNIVFSEHGQIIDSLKFSDYINKNIHLCNIIVGTSWGIPKFLLEYAKIELSFGKLTMPHELVKIASAEQVYRAFTIIKGEKYHK